MINHPLFWERSIHDKRQRYEEDAERERLLLALSLGRLAARLERWRGRLEGAAPIRIAGYLERS